MMMMWNTTADQNSSQNGLGRPGPSLLQIITFLSDQSEMCSFTFLQSIVRLSSLGFSSLKWVSCNFEMKLYTIYWWNYITDFVMIKIWFKLKWIFVFNPIAKQIINKEGTYCINYLKKSSVAQRNWGSIETQAWRRTWQMYFFLLHSWNTFSEMEDICCRNRLKSVL